jgi:hypothetical protein
VRGLSEEYSQRESETDADYLARTGMASGRSSGALNELCSYIYLLCHHYRAEDYWTQRALISKDEWRLFRRLASLALSEIGWEVSCAGQQVHDAVDFFRRELTHA